VSAIPLDQALADPPEGEGLETLEPIALRLDTRGLACPMPIVKTTQAMAGLTSGQLLEVLAYHAKSRTDFPAWSRTTGHAIVESSVDGDAYRFVFRRK
jgi:tRNA 2-thiouridine synthesizing protein A